MRDIMLYNKYSFIIDFYNAYNMAEIVQSRRAGIKQYTCANVCKCLHKQIQDEKCENCESKKVQKMNVTSFVN